MGVKIQRVAASYRARGHRVRVLSAFRCEVTDKESGHVYRVSHTGTVVTPAMQQLEEELEAEVGPYVAAPFIRRRPN